MREIGLMIGINWEGNILTNERTKIHLFLSDSGKYGSPGIPKLRMDKEVPLEKTKLSIRKMSIVFSLANKALQRHER